MALQLPKLTIEDLEVTYFQLPKFTDKDFEVTYTRKRKHTGSSSSSTDSDATSSPGSSSTQSSKSTDRLTVAPEDQFLQKKRTQPLKYCPKQKVPTQRYQPINVKERKAPKIAYIAKPLQHTPRLPLFDPENNPDMLAYRAYRQMEKQKAQAAKINTTSEEPPQKKRAQLKRKQCRNY